MRWMLAAKARIDDAREEHAKAVKEEAEAERAAAMAWSTAYLAVADAKSVGERDAKAKQATAEVQYRYTLAKGMTKHASKLWDSEQAWLSALQSAAAAMRREAELAKWEPRETA
jgi:hypothetical protein